MSAPVIPPQQDKVSKPQISGALQRTDNIPMLFEQAVVDIDMGEANGLADVNGYVRTLMAR